MHPRAQKIRNLELAIERARSPHKIAILSRFGERAVEAVKLPEVEKNEEKKIEMIENYQQINWKTPQSLELLKE